MEKLTTRECDAVDGLVNSSNLKILDAFALTSNLPDDEFYWDKVHFTWNAYRELNRYLLVYLMRYFDQK